jgi:phosphoserine phosphatase
MFRRIFLLLTAVGFATLCQAASDPLPAWRDGPGKQRILDFVRDISTPGSSSYVTPAERVAVFDDDGTLWPEKPGPQALFALERLRAQAPQHPEWRTQMPFKAALELQGKYLQEADEASVFQLIAVANAGRTQAAFRAEAREYLGNTRHPRFRQTWNRLAYTPMRELFAYLRANGFHNFIVSAGSVNVARILASEAYGISSDDVIGSSVVSTLREEDGKLVLRRLATVHALNDGAVKPLSIDQHIGQRPILAVGNVHSGGDIDMLRYSQGAETQVPAPQGSPQRSLQILISHDDFEREYAYDEKDRASLNAADANGWMIVSMRYDWRQIFSFQAAETPGSAQAGAQ